MTRAPSYTYLWPATNASFRRTEVGLVREIVSAIGERSLIGQVTFPLQFSRVIPLTRRLFVGPERLAEILLLRLRFARQRFTRPSISPSNRRRGGCIEYPSLFSPRKETNERGARENDLEGWRTGRIYPLGHRGFELFVQQVALS